MPDRSFCQWFNDKTMLNRTGEEAREESKQRYQLHMGYIRDREKVKQFKQDRRDRVLGLLAVWIDGALIGACLMGLAVSVAYSLGVL